LEKSFTKSPEITIKGLETILHTRVVELIELAQGSLDKYTLKVPKVSLFSSGAIAGDATRDGDDIRFSLQLFLENYEDFLATTVPHEVAHSIVRQICGPKEQPHGRAWQDVMYILKAPANRCHNYKIARTPRTRQKRHLYKCACQEGVQVSTTIHNRIKRGNSYSCRKCRNVLT